MQQLQSVVLFLATYTYAFLLPASIIEGPIITVLAGFLSSIGHLTFWIAYGVIILGDLLGDAAYYALGYYGREGFIERYGRFLGVTTTRVAYLEKHFVRHSNTTLIAGKFAHGFGPIILITAGMVKMPFWRFLFYNLVGTIPKSLLLLLIGFYFGKAYERIGVYLDYVAIGTLAIVILGIGIYLLLSYTGRRYEDRYIL